MHARLVLVLAVSVVANLAFPVGSSADPSVTPTGLGASVRSQGTDQAEEPGRSENMQVIGHLGLGGSTADVYGFGHYAYLGVTGGEPPLGAVCPASGVKVVDISRPDQPLQVAVLQNPGLTTAEDVVVAHVNTSTFQGDLAAVGIQACAPQLVNIFRGLQLYDVTDPSRPRKLGHWRSPGTTGGCHEIDLAVHSTGQVLAACAVPLAEVVQAFDEVVTIDVTNPHSPSKISGFAAGKDLGVVSGMGPGAGEGCFPATFAHSVRFFDRGHTLAASYWDAGVIELDLRDPENPEVSSRIDIVPPDEDGDVHSVARAGPLLLIAPEDMSPVRDQRGGCRPGDWDGWGELWVYDVSDPAAPKVLSSFATPNARSKRTDGIYTIHNSEVVQSDQVFASWYSDGVRWIDLSNPRRPVERGFFVPPSSEEGLLGAPAAPLVWGVWPHNDLILVSDVHSGLWIVKPDLS
ncbi:MAG: hypothetical protein M3N32_09505 [Actinomycetota bacterium]|nr:hypothetical protein [Actinomycetota bacterium]